MSTYQNLLVAIDLSSESNKVIARAKRLVGGDAHKLSLIHVVEPIAAAGCSTFIVHARIAILQGLSPKENRDIPPLQYDRVLRLKRRYPELEIVINGGIRTLAESNTLLEELDGVMMGREAYQNPWVLARVDEELFGAEPAVLDRFEVMQRFLPYVREELSRGTPLQHMSRHILGLFHGIPGGKAFRRDRKSTRLNSSHH